jgi:hypothetical protein
MEKKDLVKGFKKVIEDIFDNYDKYTDSEKAQVKELFEKASALNKILDKYDAEHTFDWDEYFDRAGRYLDTFH